MGRTVKPLSAIAIVILLLSSCTRTASMATEVKLNVSGIGFENAWLACGMDNADLAETGTWKIVEKCLESPLIETARAFRDKQGILNIRVRGAKPAFYALAEDQVNLVSQTGKTMIGDCRLLDLDLPVVTLYDIKTMDPAFTRIAGGVAKFLRMLNRLALYRPELITYRPFAGFIVTFRSPVIKIEFGEKGLKKKLEMVPALVRKAAAITGFPAKVVLVDAKKGSWASISAYKAGLGRQR